MFVKTRAERFGTNRTTTGYWRRHERTTSDGLVVRRGHPRAPRVREGGTAVGTRLAPSGLAPARFRPPPRPSSTAFPFASHHILTSSRPLLRQTESTHLREGLLALCPGGGEAATLRGIIEACESERQRLGGHLANATDEDVRLFALFSTAAKCFLCRACEETPRDENDGALVNELLRRVWLPLLADDARAGDTRGKLDDGTRRQVVDECVAALWRARGAGDVFNSATTRALARVFRREPEPETETRGDGNARIRAREQDVVEPEHKHEHEPEFGAMRFETAVELAAALLQVAAESPEDGAAENDDEKWRAPAAAAAADALSNISRLDVKGMDATRWRRVLACLAPAAMNVCARHGAEHRVLDEARGAFRDVVFPRAWRAFPSRDDAERGASSEDERAARDFEAFFFDMLRLDATRELLLGPPGTVRGAFETMRFVDHGEDDVFEGEAFARRRLVSVLARGVASDAREFRAAALAAIRHGLGVSEETGKWTFDESPWCEFAAVVDALEDFAAHLVDAAWKHMDALHPPAACFVDPAGPRRVRVPYVFVVSAWTRGLRHANPTVRSKTLECFRAREWGADASPDASPECRLADDREVRDSIADAAEFVTETLIRAAMESPRGDEKVKDFLRAYVAGSDSRAASGATRRVTEVVAQVGHCAVTANTLGVDVGTNIVEHAARAYETAFGPSAWSTEQKREADITSALAALERCAASLLSVARSGDSETLANRARVVFDAARIIAPFSVADAAMRETDATCYRPPAESTAARDDERLACFLAYARLLRVAPSEAVDGDGPACTRARASAAAWLKAPSASEEEAGYYAPACRACIEAYVDPSLTNEDEDEDDPREARMRAAASRVATDDGGESLESHEPKTETAAVLADADALARAWSFIGNGSFGSSGSSDAFARRVTRALSGPFDRSPDGRRSIARPSKRRALLLLRAAFRLAGVLERAATKRGGDELGCSAFLATTRATFRLVVRDTELMRRVSLAAADLALGNGPGRADLADEGRDAFAVAAFGWSEAVFRWAPSTGDAFVSHDDSERLMRVGADVMRSLSDAAEKPGSEISARRRGDVALALASAARGVASASRLASRGENRETTRDDLDASASRCLVRIERSLDALERDTGASHADAAFAASAAWTATIATLALTSNASSLKKKDAEDARETARALLRRAVAWLPAAARVGATATATTFRAIASLVTRIDATRHSCRDAACLAAASRSVFEASSDILFGSSAFRKNAPVWAAAASAALHPAFFDAEDFFRAADLETMHASSGATVGACVAFVRGATALSRTSGGARAARVVAGALASRLISNPEHAKAYAGEIFELGLAGEGEQTRGVTLRALDGLPSRNDKSVSSPDVAARVSALVLAHALATGAPPVEPSRETETKNETEDTAAFSPREASASRRGALAILCVALDAVAGADEVLAHETYRRGSATHRRKVRAWQMLCTCAPALGEASPSLGEVAEEERSALIAKLIASAPACLSRRELPGVRYYAETFHCLAATHAPELVARCALPALRAPATNPLVAASWIVVAASAALRRRRESRDCDSDITVKEENFTALMTDARRVFAAVFPLSMSHNHTLRVFAQAATRDLLEAFSPSAFSRSFGRRVVAGTETETASEDASEDALETTFFTLTTDEEMLKTREACGDLFTQNLDASPRALLRGALDIEARDRAPETTGSEPGTGTETETETDVAFEGAPASAIDRVDAFLQSARAEIRSERERAEAVLWRDAMRGGHDARGTVTGVVGDDAAARDDAFRAAEENDETSRKIGSASALQKKFGGGSAPRRDDPTHELSSFGSAPAFPVPSSASGRSAFDSGEEANRVARSPWPPVEDARAPRRGGLVVVASLVEKIPNLAGLARTCEVLGAERLVVADLAVTKHRDFTSVSVTAEKWLRVDACPIAGLAAYLARLRREGYALVGLEQTRGAEDVETHGWEKKTALVLGREREGVDAHILGMLDACVVIQQRGMIRSLNVHVSASIAVARYAAAAARNGW